MTGLAIGLMLGLGLHLVSSTFWSTGSGVGRQAARRVAELIRARAPAVDGGGGFVRVSLSACALGVGASGTAYLLTRLASVAGIALVAGAFASHATAVKKSRARLATRREQWPDAVDHIASGVRAGLSIPEALVQLSETGPAGFRDDFGRFAADYRFGGSFTASLDRLKDRLADPIADRLLESLRLARDVGGSDVGPLLAALSAYLRADIRARAELSARQSWTVNGARVAAAAPWVVVVLLATRPEAADAFRTPEGTWLLLGGALVTVLAYRLMLRLAAFRDEARMLR